jgi:hypothetical protein
MPIYKKSTKELFEEFIKSFVPPPSKGFGLAERKTTWQRRSLHTKKM